MNNEPVVIVKNLRKTFTRMKSDYGLKDVLLHSIVHFRRYRERQQFVALNDISLVLNVGESLAILGANGAGKSTLLALLAGIIRPTVGTVSTFGRIGLMLELGSGFCHDLSGRENIELNGLLLGENRKNLTAKTAQIIEFSGLKDCIDEPLRTYSTGMQTRLGFSIAAHVSPALMLIDEVLAVGDSEFQRKCLTKLREMQQHDVAIVLVTHSLEAAEQFCDRAIYLEKGMIRFAGTTAEVIAAIRTQHCEF